MQNRKSYLAEIRSQEKLHEMEHLSDSSEDAFENFYYDDEYHNYQEYLRQQNAAQKHQETDHIDVYDSLDGDSDDNDDWFDDDDWDDWDDNDDSDDWDDDDDSDDWDDDDDSDDWDDDDALENED